MMKPANRKKTHHLNVFRHGTTARLIIGRAALMGFSFVLAETAFGLTTTEAALAQRDTCSLLFAQNKITEPQTLKLADQSQTPLVGWRSLNEASREFVTRLHYLLNDRRVFSVTVLKQILSSPKPFNPLGDRPSSLQLQPHQAAFAQLLREDLEWDRIQTAVGSMLASAGQQQQRHDTAVVETEGLPWPKEIKSLPFLIDHLVKSPTGQVLAVSKARVPKSMDTAINLSEISSGNLVSSVPIGYVKSDDTLDVLATNETVLASITKSADSQILTVDLLNKTAFPAVNISKAKKNQFDFRVHLTDDSGKPRVATFLSGIAFLFDVLSGTEVKRVPFDPKMAFSADDSRKMGHAFFVKEKTGPSHIIDFSQQSPLKEAERVQAIDIFDYNGKTYAVGEPSSPPPSIFGSWRTLQTFDLSTAQDSAPFSINTDTGRSIRMLERFEDNGILYGLIATKQDLYVVNLLKGEVVRTYYQVPLANHVLADWESDATGQVGFYFHEKFYFVALVKQNPNDQASELAILDPLTMTAVGPGLKIDQRVLSIHKVPGESQKPQIVLTLVDGTSRLISLVNPVE